MILHQPHIKSAVEAMRLWGATNGQTPFTVPHGTAVMDALNQLERVDKFTSYVAKVLRSFGDRPTRECLETIIPYFAAAHFAGLIDEASITPDTMSEKCHEIADMLDPIV